MTTVVLNVHERVIPANADALGRMIDTLGSAGDMVWPSERWPPMKLDRPLEVGASGGHRKRREHAFLFRIFIEKKGKVAVDSHTIGG